MSDFLERCFTALRPEGEVPDAQDRVAIHVLATVLVGMQGVERGWSRRELPGYPSVHDFARGVTDSLRDFYGEEIFL